MKTLFKNAITFLIVVITFSSCVKENIGYSYNYTPPPPYNLPPTPSDTLSGREYIFDSLDWSLDFDWGLYAATPSRQDLFFNSDRGKEVSLKLDPSANWISVPRVIIPSYSSFPIYNGFLYGQIPGTAYLILISYPMDNSLIGKKVSIKVKFL